MNRQQRRKARLPKADRHPRTGERVHDLTSAQLEARLVQDAAAGYATPIEWAFNAYVRIASLDGISKDAAFLRVRQAIAELGVPLPDAPGS